MVCVAVLHIAQAIKVALLKALEVPFVGVDGVFPSLPFSVETLLAVCGSPAVSTGETYPKSVSLVRYTCLLEGAGSLFHRSFLVRTTVKNCSCDYYFLANSLWSRLVMSSAVTMRGLIKAGVVSAGASTECTSTAISCFAGIQHFLLR